MDPSLQLGEGPEPSETSHDTSRSADTLRPRRAPQHPHATRTKHPSGSNVSFSHDTEGGEDQHAQVNNTNITTTTDTTTDTTVQVANMLGYNHKDNRRKKLLLLIVKTGWQNQMRIK